jgi:hypothetical protein
MTASTARRPLPAVAFLLVLSVLTAIVWWRVLHRPDSSGATGTPAPTKPITCASGSKAVVLPQPDAVTVVVLNGAGRDQLASQVSAQLKARGFTTGVPGDAPAPLTGVGQIQFGRAGKAGATLLSFYVPGAKLVAANRADAGLTLVLGSGYRALAAQATVNGDVAQAKKSC